MAGSIYGWSRQIAAAPEQHSHSESATTLGPRSLRYRRVMDWDVEPTPFKESVTISNFGTVSRSLVYDENLNGRSEIGRPRVIQLCCSWTSLTAAMGARPIRFAKARQAGAPQDAVAVIDD